jgi:hypothetical protein
MSSTGNSTSNGSTNGSVTSNSVPRKNPTQGKFKSDQSKTSLRVDKNRHGIRRETILGIKKTTKRPKKV